MITLRSFSTAARVSQITDQQEKMESLFEFFNKDSRLKPGVRVQGKFGPLVANPKATPGKKTRRIRSHGTGVVVEACGPKMWKVKVDQTGEYMNICSYIVKIINNAVGLPVNEIADTVSKL